MTLKGRTNEWLLAIVLALFMGVGAGLHLIIGEASDIVEEKQEIGNLEFKQLGPNLYSMTGDVGIGDCERIVPMLPTTAPFTLILESPGGSLQDGMCLSAHLQLRNVITVVRDTAVLNENGEIIYTPGLATTQPWEQVGVTVDPHDAERERMVVCASSCSLIFMGGDERYLIGDVYLGIHSPRSTGAIGSPASAEASAYAISAQLMGFLEHSLGIKSSDLRRFFITIPANSMYWVNPRDFQQNAWLIGIATHYLGFHDFNAVNPYASLADAIRDQAKALNQEQGVQ